MITNISLFSLHMHNKVVIHLTDGLDAQYNVMKERVEKMREDGKNNHFKNFYYCITEMG